MDLSHVFDFSRWRSRFRGERAVPAAHGDRAPDATVDEVDVPGDALSFDGRPLSSRTGNGQGTGDPRSGGWAGWGA